MASVEKYLKFLSKAAGWPWRIASYSLVASFLVATVFSLVVSVYLKPELKTDKSNKRKTQIDFGSELSWVKETLTKAQTAFILDRNIFNSEGKYPDDDSKSEEDGEGDAATKLPLTLLGVISGGNLHNGIAIVRNTKTQINDTDSYLVDDLIQPFGAQILEIYPKKIYILNNGRREFLQLEEKPIIRSRRIAKRKSSSASFKMNSGDEYREEGFERIGNNVRIDDSYRQNLLTSQFSRVLQDAKAEPFMQDGEVIGWKMVNIKKNSIYEKMGMRDGDVVKEINGIPLTDAGKAIKSLNKMRKENKYNIKIDRGGADVDLNMNVSGG